MERSAKNSSVAAFEKEIVTCTVCGADITDMVYAVCENCGKTYHMRCLKKKFSVDSCSHSYLTLKESN